MFPQEFYLVSLPLFLQKGAKFTPWKFRKWFKCFLLKPSFFLLINSFINFFLSWQCPGHWSVFVDDPLTFSNVFKTFHFFRNIFWQRVAFNLILGSHFFICLNLILLFFFTFAFCNKDYWTTKGETSDSFKIYVLSTIVISSSFSRVPLPDLYSIVNQQNSKRTKLLQWTISSWAVQNIKVWKVFQ